MMFALAIDPGKLLLVLLVVVVLCYTWHHILRSARAAIEQARHGLGTESPGDKTLPDEGHCLSLAVALTEALRVAPAISPRLVASLLRLRRVIDQALGEPTLRPTPKRRDLPSDRALAVSDPESGLRAIRRRFEA